MALRTQSPAKHNQMLGRFLKDIPPDSKHDDIEHRPSKRRKQAANAHNAESEDSTSNAPSPSRVRPQQIPDPDVDSDVEIFDDLPSTQRTDLESALPAIKTDKEAIEEYEAQRAAENAELGLEGRMEKGEWVKGRTSIYVDAFNLALDTVLEEESHLFDAAEMGVFQDWKTLSYEAQYLYSCRLFQDLALYEC